MLNVRKLIILFLFITFSLLSGFAGYKLNECTPCNKALQKSIEQNKKQNQEHSLQVQELEQQIADIDRQSKRNRASFNEVIAELRKEASDCRYTETYHNLSYGFKISLPSDKWCSPSPHDKDPHLYDENGCGQNSQQPCHGIEVQDHSQYPVVEIDEIFKQIKKEGRNPVILSDFISGAMVIKSTAPSPAEGWVFEYNVFFSNQRRFVIFSNVESFESVIRTLVLDK